MSRITDFLKRGTLCPDGWHIAADPADAERFLCAKHVSVSAALGDLPEALCGGLTLRRVADLAALKREGGKCGALATDAAHAREASRITAELRQAGRSRLTRGASAEELPPDDAAPARMILNIDEAIAAQRTAAQKATDASQDASAAQPQAAAQPGASADNPQAAAQPGASADNPQAAAQPGASADNPQAAASPQQPAAEPPLFILWIDRLDNVPSLADLPGCAPDLVILSPELADAPEDAVRDACLRTLACAWDTLHAAGVAEMTSENAFRAMTWASGALESGTPSGADAARYLLERGHEGGYADLLGRALHERYGLGRGLMSGAVLPGLCALLPGDRDDRAAASALTGLGLPTSLPALRLMDVPPLASAALRPALRMARPLTRPQLEGILQALHAPEAGAPDDLTARQEAFFATGRTLDVAFRLRQLDALHDWIVRHEADIEGALQSDLGKCAFEAYETEILLVLTELKTLRRRLPAWQRDRAVHTPLIHFPARCMTVRQPYGRTLIMAPWNYPFLLSVDPLLAAIGGGNCAVLKPSAYAPATSRLLADMVRELFDPEYVAVVEGGRAENQSLLEKKFDLIFFTGSPEVGKLVMKSAAEHLTPVVLELGGKSPCLVDDTADVALAARRIAWGKFVNAGQTCVAPDYVLCHKSVADALVKELEKAVRGLYGASPLTNAELCRIVNEKHFHRLLSLLSGAETAFGGKSDPESLRIEPTVLTSVSWEDPVMGEEIFGPILPVLVWDGDFDDVLRLIEARPRPLAAYLFTDSQAHEEAFLRRLRFGGGCVNDVLCHLASSSMPFGGVGESGMGAYHGKTGFETFTHEKSILIKSRHIDLPVRYAPYREKLKWLRRLS